MNWPPSKWHCHVVERGKLGECGVTTPILSYKGHRYPVEMINHCVWLYVRFPLSLRESRGDDAPTRCRGELRDDPKGGV